MPSSATPSALTLEHVDNGAIAILTINRPRRGNALDSQTLAGLHRTLDAINGDPTIRAVVLTGTGTIFCAGADMKAAPDDFTDLDATPYSSLQARAASTVAVTMAAQELMASAFEKIHRLRQPVIAAVNGAAVGGGFALALACDIRYACTAACHSPLAVWMTKETMWQTVDAPGLRHALDIENRTQVMCTSTGDLANSFAAFGADGTASWKPL